MYIKLNHNLVPGKIEDLNNSVILEGQSRKQEAESFKKPSTLNVHKYKIRQGKMKDFLKGNRGPLACKLF